MKYINTHINKNSHFIVLITLFCFIFNPSYIYSQEKSGGQDKTESPYFLVNAINPTTDRLPLKTTYAEVTISGVIADVVVHQIYVNEGTVPLEATYVFPGSTDAAVYKMTMTVGERVLVAEIREKEEAREIYEEAKEEGRTTSLLEQERPNVFQMNVANIMPRDTIDVQMHYTELITPVDGMYEFVYPTVVGPRYTGESSENEGWTSNPYLEEGEDPTYSFDIDITLDAGMDVRDAKCLSHEDANINFKSSRQVTCDLSDSDGTGGNKDFIFQYRLTGDQIESGLLLYEGEEENFFLAMVQPPKEPDFTDIPPREYVFIVDVSGSMSGFPLDVSKELMRNLLNGLHADDRFNVMLFAGGSSIFSDRSLEANEENIRNAINHIDNQSGGGGTNLLSALERALDLPGTEQHARSFVIATDGYVSIEKQAFDLIRNNLGEANFFAFGIGSGVNRFLIEGISYAGMGEPFVAINREEAKEKAELFRQYIENPVLTNIDVDYQNFSTYDVEPVSVPDVFAKRPVLLFGKWEGIPQGTITVSGISGNHSIERTLNVSNYYPSPDNSALRYLWARHRIKLLDDYRQVVGYSVEENDYQSQITELGLKYNLLTEYTSFVAVDTMIRNTSGNSETVEQPLPLPEGVSDAALDGKYSNNNGYGGWNTGAVNLVQQEETGSKIDNAYPNPFREKTKIRLYIDLNDVKANKLLEVYNQSGQLVATIDISDKTDGWHEIEFYSCLCGIQNKSGVYLVRLKVGNEYKNSVSLHVLK
jgi:Ca-activated chloride channel homolog